MRAQPWMDRTPSQRDANEIDCDIHRLIARLERRAAEATPVDRAKWGAAASELRSARFHVRELMHSYDVEQTA